MPPHRLLTILCGLYEASVLSSGTIRFVREIRTVRITCLPIWNGIYRYFAILLVQWGIFILVLSLRVIE